MSGRVCDKHGEWCPDGECRWCEPAEASGMDSIFGPFEPYLPDMFGGVTDVMIGDGQRTAFAWGAAQNSVSGAIGLQDAMNRMWATLASRNR